MSEEVKSIIEEPFYPEDCTDIRAQKNSKRIEKLEEKVSGYDSDIQDIKDDLELTDLKAGNALTKANQVGIKANNNETNINTIKNQLNGGVCKVYQKTFTVSTWNVLNMATLVDAQLFKTDSILIVSPVADSSGNNAKIIAASEIVPLEIQTDGMLLLKCSTVPSEPVSFLITEFIPLNITLQ